MTMYLPNPDLQPTGYEVTEFIDVPPMAETRGTANDAIEPCEGSTERLDERTRRTIARRAAVYISGLVESHDGDPADLRSIVHDLQEPSALAYGDGRAVEGPRF